MSDNDLRNELIKLLKTAQKNVENAIAKGDKETEKKYRRILKKNGFTPEAIDKRIEEIKAH
jgi:hypothetical protein